MKDLNVLLKALSKFVDERSIKKVRLIFAEFHSSDIYQMTKNWPIEKSVLLLRLLKEEDASDFFSEMTTEQQELVINVLSSEEVGELFEEMYTDEAIDILDDLPAKITRRILQSANQETRTKINSILRYDKFQTGYHMVVDYVAIPSNITIAKAKKLIANQVKNDDLEIIGNIFVYDSKSDLFIGYITPDQIIANNNNDLIDNYVEKITPIYSTDHINEAKIAINQYDIPSVPVINSKGKLIGAIEADDIIERYEEAEEAVYEQSAVKIIDKPYLDITVYEMFKSRIPWIIVLLIVGTLTQVVVLGFQVIWLEKDMLSDATAISGIAFFAVMTALSLSSSINDAAGNTGSQTSSTLVRAIALGEVSEGNYRKAIIKELLVALSIATSVMIVSFLRIIVVWAAFGEFGGYGNGLATSAWVWYMILIAAIASISFFVTIIFGNIIGACLPILANKFGIDGAILSGPVQTTVVDIITIIFYFSLTTIIFVLLQNSGVLEGIVQFSE